MKHPQIKARTFNIGRGVGTNLLKIIKQINVLTDQNLLPILKEARPGDVRHSLAENTALKALGWSALTSIRDGLTELLKPQLHTLG